MRTGNAARLPFFLGGEHALLDRLETRLQEMGFSEGEAACYRKLAAAGKCSNPERLRMLMDKRKAALDEIHRLEGRISDMDALRWEIRKKESKGGISK